MDFSNLHLYNVVKVIHIMCAAISIFGFLIRASLKLYESAILQRHWVRVTPHIIDTLLLVSALYLAVASHQYPIQNGWLTAKVIGLLLYIAMGFVVMRIGKTKIQQLLALITALLIAAYIITVAISKDSLPL